MSAKLYHIPGPLGSGSSAKLIHQIFAAVHIATASEAMAVIALAGLNTRKEFENLRDGEAGSWMFGNRVPYMLDRGLGRYSAIGIIVKDVRIITGTRGEIGGIYLS